MNTLSEIKFILFSLLIILYSCTSGTEPTPETALESYLNNRDRTYSWEFYETKEMGGATFYNLLLTSQEWRDYIWRHQLAVIVPDTFEYDGALLFINGGSNSEEMPNWKDSDDRTLQAVGSLALENNAIVAMIFQVPNQPLFGDLTEDEIISLTFHNFLNDNDYTWPLLFPMVKSVTRAMDAIQDFSTEILHHDVGWFLVAGASKRGWTTWLTGASDDRVIAIAPMVIDMLNMPESIAYHLEAWGDYSPQIADYVELGVAQEVNTPEGEKVVAMVDPYSYRDKLDMPKLIFNGTNDPYWPVDVIKHYLDGIPGENYLHYVPNAGHGLGDRKQAFQALGSFFSETLQGVDYPACSWELKESDEAIQVIIEATREKLQGAVLWMADSDDRDFRDNEFKSSVIEIGLSDRITATMEYPESGYRAFYIDLLYSDPHGDIYSKSTRVFVTDEDKVL